MSCSQNTERNTTRSTPLTPVEWPVVAWSKIGIDTVGELSDVPYAKRFAVTVIDYHSRWPEVHFCGTVTSQVIIGFLTELFSRWGIPDVLVSDNGSQFVSAEFELFLSSCDVKHVKSSLYYPQSDGLIERFNSSIKQAVRTAELAEVVVVGRAERGLRMAHEVQGSHPRLLCRSAPRADRNESFTPSNIMTLLIGGLVMAAAILGTFLELE